MLIATSVVASAQPALGAQNRNAVAYVVTSLKSGPQNAEATEEMLTIATVDGKTFVELQNRSGDAVVSPATLEQTGAVDITMTDPAVTCYDTAMTVISDSTARHGTSSLEVGLAGETVTVPLKLTVGAPAADGSHTVTAGGRAEASILDGGTETSITFVADAAVSATHDGLLAARFDETGVLTDTGSTVGRATCTVVPVTARPPSAPTAVPL